MGLFFAPVANVVLSAVRPEEEGQASGANNAIREVGGVFGVAVLASVFRRAATTSRRRRSSTACSRRAGRCRLRGGRRGGRVRHPQAAPDGASGDGARGIPHRGRRAGADPHGIADRRRVRPRASRRRDPAACPPGLCSSRWRAPRRWSAVARVAAWSPCTVDGSLVPGSSASTAGSGSFGPSSTRDGTVDGDASGCRPGPRTPDRRPM